ncbi:MAG: hypothetical protein HKN37_06745 [Rhodothermales bacterium]|nr:hypothetical protein [Rhodothermales bacterium]
MILASVLVAACSEVVTPFVSSDRQYSLFGTLEMDRDTQFVRVVTISRDIDVTEPPALPVVFRSHDLNSGGVVVWEDSLFDFDGRPGHVFWAPLRIQSGHTYRIEVDPDDSDLLTAAVTTAPPDVRALVLDENLEVHEVDGTPAGTQRVVWQGVHAKPFRIDIWYRFLAAVRAPFVDIRIPTEPVSTASEDAQAWEIRVDLRQDRETLEDLVDVNSMALMGIGVEIVLLDEGFAPPGGTFDPDILSQPGAFSNVENGFGFVGIVGRFAIEWSLERESLDELGYISPEDLFGKTSSTIMTRRKFSTVRDSQTDDGHHQHACTGRRKGDEIKSFRNENTRVGFSRPD